jgi:hypothetical protein
MLYYIGYIEILPMVGEVRNSPRAKWGKRYDAKYRYSMPDFVRNEICILWNNIHIEIK